MRLLWLEILKGIDRQTAEPKGKVKSFASLVADSARRLAKPLVLLTREDKFLGNMPKVLERLGFQVELVATLAAEAQSDSNFIEVFGNIED